MNWEFSRKLEFYREGESTKHITDIRSICDITGVNESAMGPWLERLGLGPVWEMVRHA
jgi:hypothetical protein